MWPLCLALFMDALVVDIAQCRRSNPPIFALNRLAGCRRGQVRRPAQSVARAVLPASELWARLKSITLPERTLWSGARIPKWHFEGSTALQTLLGWFCPSPMMTKGCVVASKSVNSFATMVALVSLCRFSFFRRYMPATKMVCNQDVCMYVCMYISVTVCVNTCFQGLYLVSLP